MASFRLIPRFLLALALGLAAACSSGETATGPGPTPAFIRSQTGNQQTGVAGAPLSVPLSVVVTDANQRIIVGTRVDWDAGAGSGSLSPSSTVTDNRGIATSNWTLGTVAGTARVTAQVNGLSPVTFAATILPAPIASVVASLNEATLPIGDTLRLRASVRDQFGNDVASQAITFRSLEPAIVAISPSGLMTAITLGSTRVLAEASGRADTVPVTVVTSGGNVCGTLPPPLLTVGEVFTPAPGASSISACLSSPEGLGAEYALTLISTAAAFGTTAAVDVIGLGTTGPTIAALTGLAAASANVVLPDAGTFGPAWTAPSPVPQQTELARRAIERAELTPLVQTARDWYAERATARRTRPMATAMTDVKVGDVLRLNANPNSACSNADTRNGRVAAVGAHSIIVSDNDNPAGGYTDAEYQSVAATFDTLVYPLDTTAFGAPTDISGYGKVILFYTRAVNALTPAGANFAIGGFFFARDLYPKVARSGLPACAASNEAEMFYLLAPDPNGTVNGNRRSKDEVTLLNLTTIAHELQHLINASRRLYVTVGAAPNEQTWLDEGLSHVAEELLYFRVGNFTSRQNIVLSNVGGNAARAELFRNYASQNFSRFYAFLINPEVNSPYAPNDSLATRGAIWNFLRFAAGRQGVNGEAAFFRALVNSRTVGVANLQGVLSGGQFADYLRDWSVSLIADDYSSAVSAGLDTRYALPAWNFRSIFPGLRFSGGAALGVYPIATRSLLSNTPQRITLAGGTSSYLRFGVPAGRQAIVTLSSNGALPAATVRYGIVRLR